MEAKRCMDSFTVKNSHVLPPDTNSHGTLFGGKLMAYIDDIAAISAVRHCRKPVVTASIDSVDFLHPVFEGNAICLEAFVTWTHNTSMEVFVKGHYRKPSERREESMYNRLRLDGRSR